MKVLLFQLLIPLTLATDFAKFWNNMDEVIPYTEWDENQRYVDWNTEDVRQWGWKQQQGRWNRNSKRKTPRQEPKPWEEVFVGWGEENQPKEWKEDQQLEGWGEQQPPKPWSQQKQRRGQDDQWQPKRWREEEEQWGGGNIPIRKSADQYREYLNFLEYLRMKDDVMSA
uniref:Uncharacterized protein n=1 Tax=Arion vulgaris TaxID=1028688 RepID=A0A0B7BWG8_9EUPU